MVAFTDSKGSAQKDRPEAYKYKDGLNRVRFVGDLLARYVYWLEGDGGNKSPVECLAFDRDTEKFDNSKEDPVKEKYPDMKCSWAYVIQGLDLNDPDNPKPVLINLKKKLTQQILSTAEDLGDPTDIEDGWDIVFEKKKTGPKIFNVEYTVNQIKSQKAKRPLNDAEREIIKDFKPVDEVLPRISVEDQRKYLNGDNGDTPVENVDDEISEEFEVNAD